MSHPRFEALREKLLRAGIAPRHVRRYIGELRQHYDDLVAEENAAGVTGAAAELAARMRLGGDDELAAAMLNRPELRSVSARYPWAVFGIAPLLLNAMVIVLLLLAEIAFMKLYGDIARLLSADPDKFGVPVWIRAVSDAWGWTIMYASPFIAVSILCALGARQRLATGWIILGGFFCALVGAVPVGYSMKFPTLPGKGEMTLGAGFNSDITPSRIAMNIAIIAVMIAIQWWLSRRSPIPE